MKIASRVKLASRSTGVVGGDHADHRDHDFDYHGNQSDLGDHADRADYSDPGDHTDQSDHSSHHDRHVVECDHDGRLCSKKSCHRELRAFIFSSCDCDRDICKYIDVLEAIEAIICSHILQLSN